MPVRRVNFTVDETAVGEGGSARERLRLEINTNGSITPPSPLRIIDFHYLSTQKDPAHPPNIRPGKSCAVRKSTT